MIVRDNWRSSWWLGGKWCLFRLRIVFREQMIFLDDVLRLESRWLDDFLLVLGIGEIVKDKNKNKKE